MGGDVTQASSSLRILALDEETKKKRRFLSNVVYEEVSYKSYPVASPWHRSGNGQWQRMSWLAKTGRPERTWASLASWWPTSMAQLRAVEERILSCLKVPVLSRFVPCSIRECLWTVTACTDKKAAFHRTPLVLIHGFAGGVGLWALNLDALASRRTVHAFDLLGFGRSSRPHFVHDACAVEHCFVESIEAWREALGLPEMVLLGHSLGGFLAASYAIEHPERVKHLILVDPWGFPEKPQNFEDRLPTWLRAAGLLVSQFNLLAGLRMAGPWGPGLVQKFRPDFTTKFSSMFQDDTISEYIYHCNAQAPSGEIAFKTMTDSLGWAKRPMLQRVGLIAPRVSISFIYGAKSWIDSSSGYWTKALRSSSCVQVFIIQGAGHHVYADQYKAFNHCVQKICDSQD